MCTRFFQSACFTYEGHSVWLTWPCTRSASLSVCFRGAGQIMASSPEHRYRFISVWPRFGYDSCTGLFELFLFSVPAVPLGKRGFSVFRWFQYSLTEGDRSGFGFASWKTVPAVSVLLLVQGRTVATVPVRFLRHPVLKDNLASCQLIWNPRNIPAQRNI